MQSDQPTARGDRTQRRIDVIDAAAEILEESGWAGLNMREIASRAGVSAGALYQWFAGKDEIYAELYRTRLDDGAAAMERIDPDMGAEALLMSMFVWVRRTWTDLGRWQLEFAEISRAREGSDALTKLADAHRHLLEVGMRRLSEQATRDGHTLRTDLDAAHLIWATATGVAQRCEVLQLDDEAFRSLAGMAVRSLLAGLDESA